MNPERPQAIQYLRAPASGLWRWTDGGTVVAWRDGTTIAFREELSLILKWLGPRGLPSFGALMLLLAASRGKLPELSELVRLRQDSLELMPDSKALMLTAARQQLKVQLEAALTELRKLAELPAELRTGLSARCVLAEALFEHARAERHTDASAVLRGWSEVIPETELNVTFQTEDAPTLVRQIHVLAEGCRRHTAESLRLRLRTGLDTLPKKADVTLPPAERARRLIEELSHDPVHEGVARAARELMAAVRLPRHLGEREELAIGGVADITNRGPLDRLLLSELAHDDLTLAVRVALNEALFLRREPPHREPPSTLALLLDSGVRLWGVPRVLAAAVGLALAACERQHAQVLAWRASGPEVCPVDLLSRHGFIAHLETLEVQAHPGAALPAFLAAQPAGQANQTVVITHRDALADPEFRRFLQQSPAAHAGFVATVDRSGDFALHTLPLVHRPPRCAAHLDLATIFGPAPSQAVPLLDPALAAKLPAIFSVSPFPLLLPVVGAVEAWAKTETNETCAVLSDRRLIHFVDATRSGSRLLAARLPPGKTFWMNCRDGFVHLVKTGTSQRPVRLVKVSLSGGHMRTVDLLEGSSVEAVHGAGEVLLLIRAHDIRAFSLNDGRPLGSVVAPHRWVHGRYLTSKERFYCATWDGSGVRLEPVTLPNILTSAVLVMFDRSGHEGPWVVLRSGEIMSCATGQKISFPKAVPAGIEHAIVSSDGHRLYLSKMGWLGLVHLDTGQYFDASGRMPQRSLLESWPTLPHWLVYQALDAVAIHGNQLWFRGRKGRWRVLLLERSGNPVIVKVPAQPPPPLESVVSFSNFPIPAELGCSLRVATWPNGSKIFLDSRGLLHLKSHQSLPEVTLVLSHEGVAGWTSDGAVCGPRFFLPETDTSQPQLVRRAVLKFLAHI